MSDQAAVYTPTQLNRVARDLMESALGAVTVEAEISGLIRASSGHYYFTLKDERAQLKAALFKGSAARLRFAPKNGDKVRVRGRVSIYEATGSYQLIADFMEMAGQGDLHRAFEALKSKLEAEGLFAADRKRELPFLPRRLAIVTSPTGAAIRDVLSVLQRRFPLVVVDVIPVLVQGEMAAPQIVAALQAVDRAASHDVVLLTRGGGSLEDLWAFNEEPVVRAVAAMNTPIVVAVGHETDFSLAEFAADLRAPTPSAAAEQLVPDRNDMARQLEAKRSRLNAQFRHRWQILSQRLDRAQLRLQGQHPALRLEQTAVAFANLRVRMTQALKGRVQRSNMSVSALGPRLHTAIRNRLQRQELQLQGLGRAMASVNPLQTLERGYAVVRDTQGHVIQRADDAPVGTDLRISLRRGELTATVTSQQLASEANE